MLLGNELAGKLLLHVYNSYICYLAYVYTHTFAIFPPFNKNRSILGVISNVNIVLLYEQLTIHVGNNNT